MPGALLDVFDVIESLWCDHGKVHGRKDLKAGQGKSQTVTPGESQHRRFVAVQVDTMLLLQRLVQQQDFIVDQLTVTGVKDQEAEPRVVGTLTASNTLTPVRE